MRATPVNYWERTKVSLFGPYRRYYATWWICYGCGFGFMKQKHEEKVCDLCGSQAHYSHLLMLNTKRRG
jgi:rRNA maturation endonuclease Nob1